MKNINFYWIFIFIVSVTVILTGCVEDVGPRNEKEQYIYDHIEDFNNVKDYMADLYGSELPVTVPLYNVLDNEDFNIPDDIRDSFIVVTKDDPKIEAYAVGRGYDFMYIDEDYVIIWTDETLQDGIMFSDNIRNSIGLARKKYYNDLQFHRLNDEWAWVGYNGI